MTKKGYNKFSLGMEVITIKDIDFYTCHIPAKSTGVVVGYGFTGNPLIEFKDNIGGHGGVGNKEGKNGHCWWMWPSNLVIMQSNIK
jgi:hypothetical protein